MEIILSAVSWWLFPDWTEARAVGTSYLRTRRPVMALEQVGLRLLAWQRRPSGLLCLASDRVA
ncbi:hypothetical protein DL991_40950 [Amycolatopsis sp. WAC 01375]|nr:hypothetical protein DL991_40950 [Amycolatopsis sp. WAC 01375]